MFNAVWRTIWKRCGTKHTQCYLLPACGPVFSATGREGRGHRKKSPKKDKQKKFHLPSLILFLTIEGADRYQAIYAICVSNVPHILQLESIESTNNQTITGPGLRLSCRKAQSPSPSSVKVKKVVPRYIQYCSTVPSVLLVVDYSTVHYCRQYLSNTHYYNYITRTVLYVSTVRGTAQVHRSHVVCN